MCFYVRLSGGAHGFHNMDYGQACEAAEELGAVKIVYAYTRERYPHKTTRFSSSFFDKDNKEVFQFGHVTNAGQVFDPPREVSEKFLNDYFIN